MGGVGRGRGPVELIEKGQLKEESGPSCDRLAQAVSPASQSLLEGRRFMVLLGLEILSVFPAPGTGWHLAAGRQ